MNYGFNLASAGILTSMYRQDVAANNLANIETPAFKIDQTATLPRLAAREEDGLFEMPSNTLLERLGAGVLLAPARSAFSQGPVQTTGNPLDLAIQGEGFFKVNSKADGTGPVRLTRDGRFTLNRAGQLVTTADGLPVLDSAGRSININPAGGKITVHSNGLIEQNGQSVSQIALVSVPDTSKLKKEGQGLYSGPADVIDANKTANGDIVQHAIERSNVDPIRAMMQVTDASSAVSSATRIAQIHDEMMSRAINSLGRVT